MIRSHTKADVCYTTPCGRRLRAYQEVTRYLELNAIQDLTVDNFSFSTKILVGQFLEAQGVGAVDRSGTHIVLYIFLHTNIHVPICP